MFSSVDNSEEKAVVVSSGEVSRDEEVKKAVMDYLSQADSLSGQSSVVVAARLGLVGMTGHSLEVALRKLHMRGVICYGKVDGWHVITRGSERTSNRDGTQVSKRK